MLRAFGIVIARTRLHMLPLRMKWRRLARPSHSFVVAGASDGWPIHIPRSDPRTADEIGTALRALSISGRICDGAYPYRAGCALISVADIERVPLGRVAR